MCHCSEACRRRKKILLISTDPASNLKDVLETDISEKITPVNGLNNLHAVNIDPEQSAEAYRQRVLSPLEDILPDHEIAKIREELSGACTTEIAAFDEFARYIAGDGDSRTYDVIIFDTAPTGHTLRLLELPAAWSSFIETNPDGASCIGPSSALNTSKERYQTVVDRLRNEESTTIYLVSKPDDSALKEAARSSSELDEMGLKNQCLLINGMFEPVDKSDVIAEQMVKKAEQALASMPERLKTLNKTTFPLRPYNLLGLDRLRTVFEPVDVKAILKENVNGELAKQREQLQGFRELVDDLSANKKSGLIMTMGKGGVGKTAIAAAIALELSARGLDVHLTTTDPAAHLYDHLPDEDMPENLTIDRIDPEHEKKAYIEKVLERRSSKLNDEELKLLREDLESPCTEEVAVFHAFSKVIHEAKRKFVVVDTAPTGHTILLLDTTGSYHREIMRNNKLTSARMKTPYMYLQDPEYSKLLIVTLPETTPINEAAKLQDDLKRSGIEPYCWVANQSLLSLPDITDPLLKQRAAAEAPLLKEIEEKHTDRVYTLPMIVQGSVAEELREYGKEQVKA